jgi:hypothetical protein
VALVVGQGGHIQVGPLTLVLTQPHPQGWVELLKQDILEVGGTNV